MHGALARHKVKISIHALTWRAIHLPAMQRSATCDFYPRPHMEGDVCVSTTATGGSFISTHALTWRATETAAAVPAPPGISTHALTWRATYCYPGQRRGIEISTHALTWRATS